MRRIIIVFIDSLDDIVFMLEQIGTIPESITHDPTEEKLFVKASDIILSRSFREIGLKSTLIKEHADSADIHAESYYFMDTLLANTKAFRMNRTAIA